MSAEPDEHTWSPLQPGQIRLLRLDSSSAPQIECTLEAYDLDTTVKWYALSYVWGEESPIVEIRLNREAFYVTPTLHAALTAIKNHVTQATCHYLWIDAICINQRDDEEKSMQIPLMGQVYSRAELVLVWFAREDRIDVQPVTLILECLQALYLHALNGDPTSQATTEQPEGVNDQTQSFHAKFDQLTGQLHREHDISPMQVAAFMSLNLSAGKTQAIWSPEDIYEKFELKNHVFDPEHQFWMALLMFMTNPWFARIWTFQEITLASNAALIYNGGIVRWDTVSEFRNNAQRILNAVFRTRLDFSLLRQLGLDRNDLLAQIMVEVGPRRQQSNQIGQWTMLGLIRQTASRKATNPKDYIYGLLGLLDATPSGLIIDYGCSTAQVFHSAFRAIEEKHPGGLTIIWTHFHGAPKRIDGLATWSYDFSSSPINDRFRFAGNVVFLDDAVVAKYAGLYRVSFSDDLLRLSCRVLLLDRVTGNLARSTSWALGDLGDPWADRDGLFLILFKRENRLWVKEMRLLLSSSEINDLISELQGPPILDIAPDFNNIFAYCCDLDYYNIETLEEARRMIEMPPGFEDKVVNDMLHFTFKLANTYPFKTVLGRMGLSYQLVDRGDVIVLVPRGQSLFAISKDMDQYKGTAYVCGLMGSSLLHIPEDVPHQWTTVDLT